MRTFKEIYESKIDEAEKVSFEGGTKAMQKSEEIEKLIKTFDYFVGRIDDQKKYKKVMAINDQIKAKLKDEFGVTAFKPIGADKMIKL